MGEDAKKKSLNDKLEKIIPEAVEQIWSRTIGLNTDIFIVGFDPENPGRLVLSSFRFHPIPLEVISREAGWSQIKFRLPRRI